MNLGLQLVTLKVGRAWMHWQTCSEWGTSTPTRQCMCMWVSCQKKSMPSSEHHMVIWLCRWLCMMALRYHALTCQWHGWCQKKGVGKGYMQEAKDPVPGSKFGFERIQVLSYSCRVPQCVQALGFPRNTLLSGNTCLVCCFLWLHAINRSSFSFYNIWLLGWPLGECSPPEKIAASDSKDYQALSVPTEVCNADWGVLIIHTVVTYISLLQVRLIPISPVLQSLATLPFNRSSGGILPWFCWSPTGCNNYESNQVALLNRQPQVSEDVDTCKNISFYLKDQL